MENEKKEIKYFSMFTGVGGFELGLERASSSKTTQSQGNKESWKNSSNTEPGNGNRGKQCSTSSKSLPKIEQDREGRNRTSNEQGTRVRSGSISTLFTPIGCSEIDKYASELLKQRFPGIKNYGDATKIIPEELPDFDLLVGGFPCQAFSIAGKRRGFEDTRGTLFYDIARILKVKRPEHILLENVKGLLSHDRGRTFGTIIATLSELGYVVQWMVLNSKFFGVPQNRERVFIIGSLRGERIPEILPLGESSEEIDKQQPRIPQQNVPAIFASQHKIARGMPMIDVSSVAVRNKNRSIHQNKKGKKYGDYEKEYRLEEQKEGVSFTVKGATQEFMVKQNMKIRRLTPTECERLQGFPDGWTEGFSDTQRYKMMGNAVTVNVIKAVVEQMFSSHKKHFTIPKSQRDILISPIHLYSPIS